MAEVSLGGIAVGVGLSTLGAWLGWWGAARNQERQHLRSQQSIARALREDIARIREEMGAASKSTLEQEGFFFAGVVVPKIHPWVESGVMQIADAAAPALGHLMRAERELSNMRVFGRQIDEHRAASELQQKLHKELENKDSTSESWADDLMEEWKAKHKAEQEEHAVENLQFMYGLSHKRALTSLDNADKLLEALIARPAPDWLPAVE